MEKTNTRSVVRMIISFFRAVTQVTQAVIHEHKMKSVESRKKAESKTKTCSLPALCLKASQPSGTGSAFVPPLTDFVATTHIQSGADSQD